jgi:D-alanyl-D-alanine carboxypeptidase
MPSPGRDGNARAYAQSVSGERLSGGAPPPRRPRAHLFLAAAALAALALIGGALSGGISPAGTGSPGRDSVPGSEATPRPTPSASPDATAVPTFDRGARSVDDPTSIWVVVNKKRPLQPKDFTPTDLVDVPVPHVWLPRLRKEASDAVVGMFAAFTAETGLRMQSQSSYRSYEAQVRVYNANGREAADSSIARPGSSEHQTGLAIDISALPARCSLNACFAGTPQGEWLAKDAWRFGFLLRYPADKVKVTGYEFEPWHFRYIGVGLATEMHDMGVSTLEEFFGLPAAPDYG